MNEPINQSINKSINELAKTFIVDSDCITFSFVFCDLGIGYDAQGDLHGVIRIRRQRQIGQTAQRKREVLTRRQDFSDHEGKFYLFFFVSF